MTSVTGARPRVGDLDDHARIEHDTVALGRGRHAPGQVVVGSASGQAHVRHVAACKQCLDHLHGGGGATKVYLRLSIEPADRLGRAHGTLAQRIAWRRLDLFGMCTAISGEVIGLKARGHVRPHRLAPSLFFLCALFLVLSVFSLWVAVWRQSRAETVDGEKERKEKRAFAAFASHFVWWPNVRGQSVIRRLAVAC